MVTLNLLDEYEVEIVNQTTWHEPIVGFEFNPQEVIVTGDVQQEKLKACGLNSDDLEGWVDASFYIGLGIHAGINSGISAEGNVNMMNSLIQHRLVRLDEPLTVRGRITGVEDVPRGQVIETDVWFEDAQSKRAISAPRKSLRPHKTPAASESKSADSKPTKTKGAGDRPAPVIDDPSAMNQYQSFELTPAQVKAYSSEGNSIHYEMEAANQAGFRAPIIGGGMGVHYLVHTLWKECRPTSWDLSIFFRRPIFWDDAFTVMATPWSAIGLVKQGKVLTEARINLMESDNGA
tara:strand:- start:5054 stop:5926 length:873 start_codon:yes stop_codon:yes gene_type:complete